MESFLSGDIRFELVVSDAYRHAGVSTPIPTRACFTAAVCWFPRENTVASRSRAAA